ncbi:MAG TPA: protein-glutamate O-methyltransferase CheR [Fluviicoccus sp.]|nr:protein-glutamate O-methyltransferase CheR [Fluviicoccus sp.]
MDTGCLEAPAVRKTRPETPGYPEWRVCRVLRERTGIRLMAHQLSGIPGICHEACLHFGYRRTEQYLHALEAGLHTPELDFLVSALTVGESYFFRDTAQMELLRSRLLPEMIEAGLSTGRRVLTVWSAGCSAGQEIYSVAILLRELLGADHGWDIRLLATDINPAALKAARLGVYRKWSFRSTPPAMVSRYFVPRPDGFVLDSRIRDSVRLARLNLVDDVYPSPFNRTCGLNLILCRNVLMYLEPDKAAEALSRLAACLAPGGLLLTGPSDGGSARIGDLVRIEEGDTAYYRKPGGAHRPCAVYPGRSARHG